MSVMDCNCSVATPWVGRSAGWPCLRPMTHAPEIGAVNLTLDSGTSFSWRLLTSLTAFGARMTLEVVHWHRKMAAESGFQLGIVWSTVWSNVMHWFLELVSGACARALQVISTILYLILWHNTTVPQPPTVRHVTARPLPQYIQHRSTAPSGLIWNIKS